MDLRQCGSILATIVVLIVLTVSTAVSIRPSPSHIGPMVHYALSGELTGVAAKDAKLIPANGVADTIIGGAGRAQPFSPSSSH